MITLNTKIAARSRIEVARALRAMANDIAVGVMPWGRIADGGSTTIIVQVEETPDKCDRDIERVRPYLTKE
jgi:acetolactate synthase small subunit